MALGRPTHLQVPRSIPPGRGLHARLWRETACGLAGLDIMANTDPERVNCLRCRRTHAYTTARRNA